MSLYIRGGPVRGKVAYLISEYDAKSPPPGTLVFNARPDSTEWVCIVDTGPMEAVAWLYDESEFALFTKPAPGDGRQRKFLLIPTHRVKQIFPEQYFQLRPLKSTDIPNGFVVRGEDGKPLLVDFDEHGEPKTDVCTEIFSDKWLGEKGMPENYVALVHTVKSDERMLVKLLAMVLITDKNRVPVSAMELGRRNTLLPFVKGLRDEFVKNISGLTPPPSDTGVGGAMV